jgi:hypothetical protein
MIMILRCLAPSLLRLEQGLVSWTCGEWGVNMLKPYIASFLYLYDCSSCQNSLFYLDNKAIYPDIMGDGIVYTRRSEPVGCIAAPHFCAFPHMFQPSEPNNDP